MIGRPEDIQAYVEGLKQGLRDECLTKLGISGDHVDERLQYAFDYLDAHRNELFAARGNAAALDKLLSVDRQHAWTKRKNN